MRFVDKAESIVGKLLDIDGVSVETKSWKSDQVSNIAFLITGEKDKLLKIEEVLCQAHHGKLTPDYLRSKGLVSSNIPGFVKENIYERVSGFLNDHAEILGSTYLGLGGDADYVMEISPRRKVYIGISY